MRVRPPAVAGQFYPSDAAQLKRDVDVLLAAHDYQPGAAALRGVIVPHAGYVYSGPVAAVGYVALRSISDQTSLVVVAGPAHRVYLEGVGTSTAEEWQTPLGAQPCAIREAEHLCAEFKIVEPRDDAHAPEHSIEVQVPFLQRVLTPGTAFLPLIVGHVGEAALAQVFDVYFGRPEVAIVVSTDLSHYLRYDVAQLKDRRTAANIAALRVDEISDDDACGSHPLRGMLWAARARSCSVDLLSLASSGDTQGPRDRVVGYGAFAVSER